MKIGLSVPGRRRDPWWDVEGRSVRRHRRSRQFFEFVVIVLSLTVIAWTFAFRVASVRAGRRKRQPRPVGDQGQGLAERQPQRQQHRLPRGRDRAVPDRRRGSRKGSHSIHINYDFTAGGHKAYDFLATWNSWAKPGSCANSGGGISSMCPSLPAASSFPFPADPYVANGLSVNVAEVYSGVSRRLTIWGGTITSIKGPVHSGSVNGNSTADYLVTFTSTGSAVLMSWGGHLAQSAFWDVAAGGARDGAGQVSGAPWHMRTLQLDGSGNKNQDRSIQPSAIVGELPPFALAPPTPTPRPTTPLAAPTPATCYPTTAGGRHAAARERRGRPTPRQPGPSWPALRRRHPRRCSPHRRSPAGPVGGDPRDGRSQLPMAASPRGDHADPPAALSRARARRAAPHRIESGRPAAGWLSRHVVALVLLALVLVTGYRPIG